MIKMKKYAWKAEIIDGKKDEYVRGTTRSGKK